MKKGLLFNNMLFCIFLVNPYVYSDTTYVSGTIVNQIWSKSGSPYYVEGNINVASLTIEEGVKVVFLDNYKFEVSGKITAKGTRAEPIYFTQDPVNEGWGGILFQNSPPGSELQWCVIERAVNSGVRIIESTPGLRNCIIRENSTLDSGGGLKIYLSTTSDDLDISNCIIDSNSTKTRYSEPSSYGGGIYIFSKNSKVRLMDCTIKNNLAYRSDGSVQGGGVWISGDVEFINSWISNNEVFGNDITPGGSSYGLGGGIYIYDGSVSLLNTIIQYNLARGKAAGGYSGNKGYGFGGGVFINDGFLSIMNSICSYNNSSGTHGSKGSGLYTNSGEVKVVNSTLAYNNLHAIENISSIVNMINSIIYFNNNGNDQIAGNVNILYCDVQNGYAGDGNINYNPVFYNDTTLRIIHGSPCIDEGNPNSIYSDVSFPPSLGGARNDIGAHGGPAAVGWLDTTKIINTSDCDFYTSPSGNYIWTETGTYKDTIQYVSVYDSIITVNLTILKSYTEINERACDSFVSPSGRYVWDESGIYSDTIPNIHQCDSIITIDLTIISLDTTLFLSGDTIFSADSIAAYQWLDCNNDYSIIEGENLQYFIPSISGNYAVEISKGTCIDTSRCVYISPTYMFQNNILNNISIYPNPTTGRCFLNPGKFDTDVEIWLKNILGQVITYKRFTIGENIEIPIQGENGLYFIEIWTDKGKRVSKKVVKISK